MTSKTLILIDGHALAYRSYFALERTRMKTTNNVNTWAVYGFLKAIFDLLKNVKPDAIAVSFDKGRDTFRLKEYAEYKANRQAMPDSLGEQLKLIIEGVKTLEIPIYQIAGYEADDVIGTISKKASELGHKTLILTGDKDSFQLISSEDSVSVLIPTKGELVEFDRDKVYEKLGVWPEQVADYKALSGDPSDNIPGVKGIGDKTAVKLLAEYGNLENIYEHIEEISSKSVKQKLEADKEMALKSQFLATICREVPIDFDFEHTHTTLPDVKKLSDFLREMQFKSFITQLPEILALFNGGKKVAIEEYKEEIKQTPVIHSVMPEQKQGQMQLGIGLTQFLQEESKKTFEVQTEIINTKEKIEELIKILENASVFSFDTETTGLDVFNAELVGLSFGWNPDILIKDNKVQAAKFNPEQTRTVYIPVGHKNSENQEAEQLKTDYVLEKLKPIFENPQIPKILQNAKYEINILKSHNINLNGVVMDTMIASYVKNPSFRHGLKAQAFGYLGYEMTEIEELIGTGKNAITMDKVAVEKAADYACGDAKSTLELGGYYAEHFTPEEEKLFYEIEEPLVPVLAQIERNGVHIDTVYLKNLSDELNNNICKLEEKIFEFAGEHFNINSPKQVSYILFDKLKLPVKGKTQTGFSTNAKVLESLKHVHPIIDLLLSQRHYSKLKSTYVDALPQLINPKTGRIHTSFNQTITTTGRLSSSNPNLQNIPIRSAIGNRIRAAFIPEDKENFVILSADYSQIELRLLAHVTKDETLLMAYRNNEDIHAQTASKVFGIPLEEVTGEMRRRAKAVNFGIIYGQTSFGLSESLGIKPSEAKEIIEKYFATYPKIKQYMDETIYSAHNFGYVETLYGRKRELGEELNSRIKSIREFAERAAINAPLQGTAADIIKLAMVKLSKELKEKGYKSKIILQVHDELVMEVLKSELDEVTALVKECMELGQPLAVPLIIDIAAGPTWMEIKE